MDIKRLEEKFRGDWRCMAAVLAVYDIVSATLAHFGALWLRFDLRYTLIPTVYINNLLHIAPFMGLVTVVVLWRLRLYQSIWKFASLTELICIVMGAALMEMVQAILIFSGIFRRMPVAYYFVGFVLTVFAWALARFAYRFALLMRSMRGRDNDMVKVLLIGAGQAGQLLLHDARREKWKNIHICGIIDDDRNKWGRFIDGVLVLGGRDEILAAVQKYKIREIYVAIPAASSADKRDILNICNETGCILRNLPSLRQIANGDVSIRSLKEVAIEDLLGREPVKTDLNEIFHMLSGMTILVTGGGGSIGSELCRQIAAHQPGHLIILDICENYAYDIERELRHNFPNMHLTVLIGSVRDKGRLEKIFSSYKPDYVYHAAAHKHVPLMEYSPCESVKNNVMGTLYTAQTAAKHGVKRFVLISTDKAVNPTNIMGASKRLCEMIIQTINCPQGKALLCNSQQGISTNAYGLMSDASQTPTEFVAVRFGNVLGSNGSVIPFFKKQIAAGGPVTVTHPDIVRYFMTIPEAVALVLQAGSYAQGGEIFVLDMGEPVKIDTLARNLIRLSGLKPDEDIAVEYVGLRPGEKLYEEKLMAEEGLTATKNQRIFVAKPVDLDAASFYPALENLISAAYKEDDETIKQEVAKIVGTYRISQ